MTALILLLSFGLLLLAAEIAVLAALARQTGGKRFWVEVSIYYVWASAGSILGTFCGTTLIQAVPALRSIHDRYLNLGVKLLAPLLGTNTVALLTQCSDMATQVVSALLGFAFGTWLVWRNRTRTQKPRST